MTNADSTVTPAAINNSDYTDFSSNLIYEIFQIAALTDCARALSEDLSEDVNMYLTRALRVITEKLECLAGEVDSKTYDYVLKPTSK